MLRGEEDPPAPGLGEARSVEETDAKRVQVVDWDGYRGIDCDEVARGAVKGKPREKLVDIREMLEIARGASR